VCRVARTCRGHRRQGLAVVSETSDGTRCLYIVDGYTHPAPVCAQRGLPRVRSLLAHYISPGAGRSMAPESELEVLVSTADANLLSFTQARGLQDEMLAVGVIPSAAFRRCAQPTPAPGVLARVHGGARARAACSSACVLACGVLERLLVCPCARVRVRAVRARCCLTSHRVK
jgi:hypothetical protein